MIIEVFGEMNIYMGMGILIFTGFILGGLIGLDREKKNKSAGIKTNMLICIGATLYTAMSIILQKETGGISDPNRVAAQVVSGIGFLGAGAIIQGKGSVIGLTTAATIWVVAAIGVCIGTGYPFVATIFTVTILAVLKVLDPLYNLFELKKAYHIEVLSNGSVKGNVTQLLLKEVDSINEVYEEKMEIMKNKIILHVYVSINPNKLKNILFDMQNILQVEKVNAIITDEE